MWLVWIAAVISASPCRAERSANAGIATVGMAEYNARLQNLRELVLSCKQDASLCRPASVGGDQRIEPEGFQARYGWLRGVMDKSSDPGLKDRDTLLDQALARVEEEIAEANADAASVGDARRVADSILATREFRTVRQSTWLEEKEMAFWAWVNRLLGGVSDVAGGNPWLKTAFLWGLLALACAGLAAWAIRVFQRQRFAVRINYEGSGAEASAPLYAQDWAALARQRAAEGDWREAIHCTYWASIVMLEKSGRWRRGSSRTPREYVRLLPPGSAQRNALGRLTALFERVWYGQRPAAQADFRGAEALRETLRNA